MDTQESPATTDDTRRFPRWLVRLALVLSVLFALGVLRTAVTLGAAFVHYRTSQDFESFVAERAVPAGVIESWLPTGELLASDEMWTAGEFETPESEILKVATDVTIKHGDEVLLETTVEFEVAVDPETWDRRGYRIAIPDVRVRDGMHSVVQVCLQDAENLFEERGAGSPKVMVDVLLVAGDGPNSFRVIEVPGPYERLVDDHFDGFALRALLGLAHPSGDLPDEGLIHQVRGRFRCGWNKTPNGSGSAGFLQHGLRTNCHEYSYDIEIALRDVRNEHSLMKTSQSWSRNYTWNDRVW